jgi:hypothetical protein
MNHKNISINENGNSNNKKQNKKTNQVVKHFHHSLLKIKKFQLKINKAIATKISNYFFTNP